VRAAHAPSDLGPIVNVIPVGNARGTVLANVLGSATAASVQL
jgi:hypothetical protein